MINSEIKRVHSLEKIKYRQRYQQYFIEGKTVSSNCDRDASQP